MGFKEVIQRIGEKQREKKEMIKRMDDQLRFQKIVEDRQKSSNERELERFQHEEREVAIKEALQNYRKQRQHEINFEHNPINTKNIMKAEWEVMKEKNQFSGKSNIFSKHENIHKNNKKICEI
jgi:hypothetical protein